MRARAGGARGALSERVDIELRPSDSLTPAERDEIWAITERYVETPRAVFEEKLRKLPEVGLWRVRRGPLAGLVSLDAYRVEWEGRTSTILFTSSVVIDTRYRRRNLVIRTGAKVLLREKLRRPWEPAWWFFDTFSYKSYLLMARNFTECWPRRGRVTPARVARFVDFLARQRYGDAWSAETGVVKSSGQKRLRATTAPVDEALLADPDVRFFESANPGHRDGDMLVCLASLSLRNFLGPVVRAVTRRR